MSNKVYVDVLAEFSKDGLLIPKEITREDDRRKRIVACLTEDEAEEYISQYKGWWSWRALYLCGRWKGNIPFL